MRPTAGRELPHAESGFALIEVLISGVIAVIAVTGVMSLMQTSVRQASDQRNRTQAYSLAQEDQARLRSMRIPTLKTYEPRLNPAARSVTIDGIAYTVQSYASFVTDATGKVSCGSSADYIRISSEVKWPNMSPIQPVVFRGIIAPPNGALASDSGSLSVTVINDSGVGEPSIGLSGSGKSTFSGSTDTEGCAVFTELPEGEYSLLLSGTNLVDKDGNSPTAKPISILPETTTNASYAYDTAGSATIAFKTKNYSGTEVTAKTEKMIAVNGNMQTPKVVGSASEKKEKLTATPLYPFASTDAFYAGACITNNPSTGSAIANLTIPAGGSVEGTVLLPPLWLTVKNSGGTGISGASVKVKDNECEVGGSKVTRTYTTNTSGQLPEPGLPWSNYEVCASASISSIVRHETLSTPVSVKSTAGNTATITLTTGDLSGGCP